MAYKSTYGAQIISQKIDEIISCLQDSAFDNYFIRIGK